MIAKNLLHQAILRGHSARFSLASDMLHDLAAQDSSTQLARRLRRYTSVPLLCIDEVGYLSYDSRYADLLFEVITRRYQQRATVLTTNKSFGEWNQVFPNAACVVTLVDRLVHRSEILAIDGDSYRLKEAQERAARRKPPLTEKSKTVTLMEPNDLPIVCLPLELSDDRRDPIDFLHDLTDALERHYAGQLLRRQHSSSTSAPPSDLTDAELDTAPPF